MVMGEAANGLFFPHYCSEILHQLPIIATLSHCLRRGLVPTVTTHRKKGRDSRLFWRGWIYIYIYIIYILYYIYTYTLIIHAYIYIYISYIYMSIYIPNINLSKHNLSWNHHPVFGSDPFPVVSLLFSLLSSALFPFGVLANRLFFRPPYIFTVHNWDTFWVERISKYMPLYCTV